jgi:hypothetical protein
MKRFLLLLSIGILIFAGCSAAWYMTRLHGHGPIVYTADADKLTTSRLAGYAPAAALYAKQHHFNTQVCFIADMRTESGKCRFFVYDLIKKQVRMKGLVTHGRCNENWLKDRKYGNDPGCGCTSLGKYKIGIPYQGRFGLAYKLYGLDASNSNAYNRFVVLHSMQCVPEKEVDPYPICQSDGCPTVSPGFLKQLATIIDGSGQPVLLWIVN